LSWSSERVTPGIRSYNNGIKQYFRVYSPVAFGKKTDPSGEYIRHWLPELSNYPNKFIYEPWKAPITVQEKAGCVIGRDYPAPIVNHEAARDANMAKMKEAYAKARDPVVPTVNTSSSNSTSAVGVIDRKGPLAPDNKKRKHG